MPRETVGRCRCPFTGEFAEVRRNKNGLLYLYGAAGMVTPNLPAGQEWIRQNAEFEEKPQAEAKPAAQPEKAKQQPTTKQRQPDAGPAPVNPGAQPVEPATPEKRPKPAEKGDQWTIV